MSSNNDNINIKNIQTVPSELQKDEKLVHCIEMTMRKTTTFFLLSAIPAFFVPGRYGKVASVGLLTGIGFGMGLTECRFLFEKNITFQKKYIATIQVNDDEESK